MYPPNGFNIKSHKIDWFLKWFSKKHLISLCGFDRKQDVQKIIQIKVIDSAHDTFYWYSHALCYVFIIFVNSNLLRLMVAIFFFVSFRGDLYRWTYPWTVYQVYSVSLILFNLIKMYIYDSERFKKPTLFPNHRSKHYAK